jgi:type VI secretion system secreted protein VgrG
VSNDPQRPDELTLEAMYELRAGTYAPTELHVLSFEGREEMNGLYSYDILLWGKDLDDDTFGTSVLGRPAALTMRVSEESARWVHGIVSSVVFEGRREAGRCTFRLTLVPRMWLLHKRVNSRIFQDLDVQQITDAILEEHGVARAWTLLASYPRRQYCVQYQESDYHFVTRILAEEGIFFCFEQPQGDADRKSTERLALADDAHSYPLIDGDAHLLFRQQQGEGAMHAAEDHVLDFRPRTRVESTAVVMRDYDFRRPKLDLTSGDEIAAATPLEVYDHHGQYEETDADAGNAGVFLEQIRAGAREAHGISVCRRLLPGSTFELTEHDADSLNARYVVTQVEHKGVAAEAARGSLRAYENCFRCVPAAVPFRPARPTRVIQQVTETAVVVGPEGQEIYTDALGRVKVQFPWDRHGKRNEQSSCWMRVMQPWAGAGWGAQVIPRIGMEVVVSFLGGDIDRPMVMGSVYNAANLPPNRLPEKKTQSGIRTQSTPGAGGYNEILFEDLKGGELLSIRAQRNLDESASNDVRSTAGRDHTIAAGRNAAREVTADDALHVGGNRTVRVDGALVEQVAGGASAAFAGGRLVRIGGDDTVEAAGGHTLQAATFSHVLIGHGNKEGGHGFVVINGNYRIAAAEELALSAKKAIRLSCGESEILITPDSVKISTPKLELTVTEELVCKGKENTVSLGDHIEIKGDLVKVISKKASIVVDEDVTIKGTKIKLNSGEPRPTDDKDESTAEVGDVIFHIDPKLDTAGHGPLTAIIATPSGDVIEKPVDANNQVTVSGKKGEHFVLLGVKSGDTALAKKPG